MAAACCLKPVVPRRRSDAHVAAITAPEREPLIEGDMYRPPGQSVIEKYMNRRNLVVRNKITDEPFGAWPYYGN